MDKIQLLWSKPFEDGPASKFFGVNATIPINFMVQEKMNVFVYEDKVFILSCDLFVFVEGVCSVVVLEACHHGDAPVEVGFLGK